MVLHLKDEEFGRGEGTENEASVAKLQTSQYQRYDKNCSRRDYLGVRADIRGPKFIMA